MTNPTRLALLLPHTDTTLEWDLQRAFNGRCSIHAERLYLENVTVQAEAKMVEEETPRAVPFIKPLHPAVTIFGCTSAGALYGVEGERAFTRRLADELGCPVVSAFGSVLAALAEDGIRRLALFTPYTEAVHGTIAAGLRETGIDLVWQDYLGLLYDTDIGRVTPGQLLARFESSAPPPRECDALFLSCTNLRVAEIAPELSRRVGLPVLSSNLSIIRAVERQLPPA